MKNGCFFSAGSLIGCLLIAICFTIQPACAGGGKPAPELPPAPPAAPAPPEAPAPQTPQRALEPNGPAGEITFEQIVHDFGQIGPQKAQQCEFKFRNTGKGLLRIDRTQATCGCTIPTLDKKEYSPGETGSVGVEYRPDKRPGQITKHIYVYTNDPAREKVELLIRADIVLKIDYEPKKMSLRLNEPNAGCPKITLKSLDGQPFSVTSFATAGDVITADVNASVKATSFVIEPKVDLEKLRHDTLGKIDIMLTHPECSSIAIPYAALPEFQANPGSIILLNADPNQAATKELWILNNYRRDFEIESISSSTGLIKVLSQEKIDNNRYKITLQIAPPALEGNKRHFSDTLKIAIKDNEPLLIPCRGFYPKKRGLPLPMPALPAKK